MCAQSLQSGWERKLEKWPKNSYQSMTSSTRRRNWKICGLPEFFLHLGNRCHKPASIYLENQNVNYIWNKEQKTNIHRNYKPVQYLVNTIIMNYFKMNITGEIQGYSREVLKYLYYHGRIKSLQWIKGPVQRVRSSVTSTMSTTN